MLKLVLDAGVPVLVFSAMVVVGMDLTADDFRRVAGPDAQLVRRVHVVRGRLPLEVECRPAFDYARARHITRVGEHGTHFDGPGLTTRRMGVPR